MCVFVLYFYPVLFALHLHWLLCVRAIAITYFSAVVFFFLLF